MKRSLIVRLAQSKVLVPVLAGGMALQFGLGGCDQEVQEQLLTGVATSLTGLVTTVIGAFFQSLADVGSSTTTQPVVQAAQEVVSWFA
ncbi:MAG TPA: hypothetical protein VJZ71_17935 [Phycisphaerae bacterium]|nr:hypothetical protein [Phycisphaerae bacterium]